MIIHGTYRVAEKRVACRNAYCTVCARASFAEGFRSLLVFHVFFIPLLPFMLSTRWICAACHQDVDLHRPSRPFILVAGVVAGIVMVVLGVLISVVTSKPEMVLISMIGLVMALVLGYLRRKNRFDEYERASQAVTPLSGECCPYCQRALLNRPIPRCHYCRVDVVLS
jgi:hypothetical protein